MKAFEFIVEEQENIELNLMFEAVEDIVAKLSIKHQVDEDVVWNYIESLDDSILYEMAITQIQMLNEDWQKTNRRDKTAGMSRKAVKAYRRENPGSKLQTAVTTKPSKLKKGSKSAKRRKSFCARMSGMKRSRASAKTKRDPNSNINKALRRWNC